MANYTSCKVLIKQINGHLEFESIKKQILLLKEENNIGQTIQVYHSLHQNCFELQFGSKWYASTINKIFKPDKFEIWVIASDEGGASDYLNHYSTEGDEERAFAEKAIYKFDQIKLSGKPDEIFNNLQQIFGWGINSVPRWNRSEFVEINLSGIYKSNNYFAHEYNNEVVFNEIDSIPSPGEFNNRTELWEMMWDADRIEFRNNFYQEILNPTNGKNPYDYLNSIEFKYKGKITNKFERRGGKDWSHKAINSYFNLVNTNYLMYLNKIEYGIE